VSEIVTGKPVSLGGIEGRREATGLGVVHLIARALDGLNVPLAGATAIIQGFGNVGSHVAQAFAALGGRIVGVSDETAAFYDPAGLDVAALTRHVGQHRRLAGFSSEATFDPVRILEQPCDVLVPAAVERVINGSNAAKLQCRVIAEAANGPTTPEADAILAQRPDVIVIPDILCNAGGVIVSYFEWVQNFQQVPWRRADVVDRLYRQLDDAFRSVMEYARRRQTSLRTAATAIAVTRVWRAKETRGLFP
jgi:glutamate dehydrogenase (NAD(P)+)